MSIRILAKLRFHKDAVWKYDKERDLCYYDAKRVDDSLFGDLLDSVLVEDECLSELELPESINEIISDTWLYYVDLVNWMERVGEPYLTFRMCDALRVRGLGYSMMDYLSINYDDLYPLSSVLRLPKGWERCVSPSWKDLPSHIEAVGRQLCSLPSFKPYARAEASIGVEELEHPALSIIDEILNRSSADQVETLRVILYGTLYLSMVGNESSAVRDVRVSWNAALTLMGRLGVPLGSLAYSSVATLAGYGKLDLMTIDVTGVMMAELNSTISDFVVPCQFIRDMYSMALDAYPSDSEPRHLGIYVDRQPPDPLDWSRNELANIVPMMNVAILGMVTSFAKRIGWSKERLDGVGKTQKTRMVGYNLSLFHAICGRKAFVRILQSLEHAIKKKEHTRRVLDRYQEMATEIQSQLESFFCLSTENLPINLASWLYRLSLSD